MGIIPEYIKYFTGFISTIFLFFSSLYFSNTIRFVWLLFFAIIFGMLTGFLIWHNHILKIDDSVKQTIQKEFILACNNFRKAFTYEYSILDSMILEGGKKPYIYIMLRNARTKHKTAFTEFMLFLPEKQKAALRKAWIEYSGEDYKEKDKNRPFYYTKESKKTTSELAQEVMSRMDRLLEFADYKFHTNK